jgi:hypothetical protein
MPSRFSDNVRWYQVLQVLEQCNPFRWQERWRFHSSRVLFSCCALNGRSHLPQARLLISAKGHHLSCSSPYVKFGPPNKTMPTLLSVSRPRLLLGYNSWRYLFCNTTMLVFIRSGGVRSISWWRNFWRSWWLASSKVHLAPLNSCTFLFNLPSYLTWYLSPSPLPTHITSNGRHSHQPGMRMPSWLHTHWMQMLHSLLCIAAFK